MAEKKVQKSEQDNPTKAKYPDLWEQREALLKDKEKIAGRLKPLRDEREKILAKIAPLEAELRKVTIKIKKDMPRLVEIDNQVGALSRAMGGKSTSQGE